MGRETETRERERDRERQRKRETDALSRFHSRHLGWAMPPKLIEYWISVGCQIFPLSNQKASFGKDSQAKKTRLCYVRGMKPSDWIMEKFESQRKSSIRLILEA